MSEKEQQFKRIYEKTKDFGRIHFVSEIQKQINDNKKKDELIKQLKKQKADVVEFIKEYHNYENRFKWCEQNYIDTINEIERMLGEIDDR